MILKLKSEDISWTINAVNNGDSSCKCAEGYLVSNSQSVRLSLHVIMGRIQEFGVVDIL